MSNAAQRARFGPLHTIRCELLKPDEFFLLPLRHQFSVFSGGKEIASLLIERYDLHPQSKEDVREIHLSDFMAAEA